MPEAMDVDQEDTALQKAEALEKSNASAACQAYSSIIHNKEPMDTEEEVREREIAIYRLGELHVKGGQQQKIVDLLKELRPLFAHFPKAKTAKIVRSLIDMVHRMQQGKPTQVLVDLCRDSIEWATKEKRAFLKHRVETRLCAIYVDMEKYDPALKALVPLLREVKQLDDKLLLVEIYLIECKVNFAVANVPKAKAALTAAKTNANAIHCPPLLQAEIDLQSGIVALRERDYRTSFSYLYEAFEAYNVNKDEKSGKANSYNLALTSLTYQLLTKIMGNEPKACRNMVTTKSAITYQTEESVQAMLKIAAAYEDRSLKKLEKVLDEHKAMISDPVIQHHLKELYENFLEQNLLKILEPFVRVEIDHVAEMIELPSAKALEKLSNMILDKKLKGTLDQGRGHLLLYEEETTSKAYDHVVEIVKGASTCCDSLSQLSAKVVEGR